MSYEEMGNYLKLLKKQQEAGQDIRIDFGRVLIDKLRSLTPGKSMGLQLADATAGSFFNALEHDRFGNTEPRYLQIMAPVLYHHERTLLGYGLKVVPRESFPKLMNRENLKWLLELK